MPATLYFGAPVRPGQQAHKEASDLGLDYLRASPSEVTVTCFKDYKQPGHTIFANNLAAFIFLSQNPTSAISSRNPIYHPLTSKGMTATMRKPVLVFSFSRSLNADQIREIVDGTGSVESKVGKNKVAFRHQISDLAALNKIQNLMPKIEMTTPTGTGEVNMKGLRIYFFLHRLFDAFQRCNQYAGFRTNDKTDVGKFVNWATIGSKGDVQNKIIAGDTVQYLEPVADGTHPLAEDRNMIFHCNNSCAASAFDYYISSPTQLSTNHTGLSFPYVPALTKADYGVVPRVIQRYFLGTLGINGDIARAEFDEVKSSWGNLCKTSWGHELAHMYRGIEIALDAQSTLRVVKTDQNVYSGLLMYGGMFQLHAQDKVFIPIPRDELYVEFKNSSPQAASLTFIYSMIVYPDAATRDAAKAACRSLRDINNQIVSNGFLSAQKDEIIRKAHLLVFPNTQGEYLNATSHNISNVFSAIGDPTVLETHFPLHPDAITSTDRTERLLSAFGTEVPSFRVPAGKGMSLNGKFSVRERNATGQPEDRDIHTIGAILLPLARAYPKFKEMKESQQVLNPFGSRLATQASSAGRIKKWEKESGDAVVVALRKAVGASAQVVDKGKKRAADDDDEIDDRGGKRAAAFSFDF